MIKKGIATTLLVIIAMIMLFSCAVFAVDDIDMNLTGNDTSQNTSTSDNTAVTGESEATNETSSTQDTSDTPRVSNLSTIPESDFGLTNILNIMLIVIGILLILLSIAILIRLKH